MKDRVFSGATSPEAVALAAASAGPAAGRLRYVVLEAGTRRRAAA